MSDQLDKIANEYNKTKNPELKKLWHEKVKEWANGVNNIKRRIVSVSSCHKRDDGTYLIIGKSRLHGDMRDTKTKTKRIRLYFKLAYYARW